jgi:hypothetical protein
MNSYVEGIFINYRFVAGRGRKLSIHMEQLGSAPTGWIFVKFDILVIFGNLSRKFHFHKYLTGLMGT